MNENELLINAANHAKSIGNMRNSDAVVGIFQIV